MLVRIRQEQLDALNQLAAQGVVSRTCEHIRRRHAAAAARLGEQGLRDEVQHSFERARTYGIRSEPSLRAFAVLWVTVGAGFDCDPRVSPILRDERFPPDVRVFSVRIPRKGGHS